jgi:hypothetical protein
MTRPSASVIVPFRGAPGELAGLIDALGEIDLGAGDELLVADNRSGATTGWYDGLVRIVPAGGVAAPGFARNRGAAVARGEWLVFIDSDTRPVPDLLDRYFDPLPDPSTAVLAGGIVDRPGAGRAAARHSAERYQMSQRTTMGRRGSPYAQTANCAVLRRAFEQIRGFDEDARAGEDVDLCFRLARADWGIEERDRAAVEHLTRSTFPALLGQLFVHGAGAAWVERRYPGEFPAPSVTELARRAGSGVRGAGGALARRQPDAAVSSLIGLAGSWAFELGRLCSNRPRGAPRRS